MKRIGILSDTHGTFDEPLADFFAPVDELWHAGDIGSLALADRIARFKPLRAVHGNIDDAAVRRVYPAVATFTVEGVRVLMTHIGGYPGHYDPRIVERLRTERPTLFIAGHSHILKVIYDKSRSLMHLNPGAAGASGFHRVRTAVRLTVDRGELHDMEVWEWPR